MSFQAELEEEQKYFESGERKEAMEEKMKTIKQLKVTVFHCPEVCEGTSIL